MHPDTDQEHTFVLGVCAGQIERKCRLAQSTVSSHLATLQRAGLITREVRSNRLGR
jgi:DNA-binding transcriptional ArsR family regulator